MMDVGFLEYLLVNNFVWTQIQKRYIIPFWDELIEPVEKSTVLELGCGRGRGTAILFDTFNPWRLDAIDSREDSVKKAADYLYPDYQDKVFVKQMKFSQIDAADEKYDIVFDFFNLHHTQNWRKAVSEISRVLKPGGYYAFGQVYESQIKDYVTKNLLKRKSKIKFDRQVYVKEMAEHRLRLLEKNHRLWGNGIIGVAKKVE